jgi:serine protease inhibitor
MPELDIDFDFGLIEILQAMGLVTAFNRTSANLEGLVERLLPDERLYISDARQVVRLIVDSEGTEAAAVTVIRNNPFDSAPLPPQLILDFNTPYIYTIYDMHTSIPLFIGIVDMP